jgi:D-3-phosphoglycerate dehydrogenase
MQKVAITTTTFGKYDKQPLDLLEQNEFSLILNPYGRKLNKDEIIQLCIDAIGIISGTEKLDAYILERLAKIKVISRCGTGLDNVDLAAAKKLGIKVFNTPDAPTIAVAELTIGLILSLLRKIGCMDLAVRNARWEKLMGNLLHKKRVGIIGFGRIGRKVAELLKPFDCTLAYSDPYVEDRLLGLERLSLRELLQWADIITIHISGSNKILGEQELSQIKKGAWLVNVSRGTAVDEEALYRAISGGYLSGAALDVFTEEPYTGPLKDLENVILTPHIGSYAREARIEMEMQAAKNLLAGLR